MNESEKTSQLEKEVAELKEKLQNYERYKALSDASYEAIFLLDKGYCVEANNAGCNLFGYPHEEIVGMYATHVIAEEYRETVKNNIINQYPEPYEVLGLRKDGSKFQAEIQGKNINYQGRNIRVTAVRDITERKAAEQVLIESESKFKAIFEHAGDGIVIGDNEGNIIEVNEGFCKLSGYAKDNLLNQHVKILFSESTLKDRPLRFDLLDIGKTYLIEREIQHKDGSLISIEMNSKRLNEKYYITIIRDLTERKKASEAIEKSNIQLQKALKKAEESDQLKSEFLANMSHEIRTPMNGVVGFAELLNDPLLDDSKRRHYTSIIINNSNQLKRIIDDILEISVLETRQSNVIHTEVNLNDLLLELFAIYDSKAKENKTPIFLNKGLSDDESLLLTDEAKLRKVLDNLIDNALHYTSEGYIEIGYSISSDQQELELYVKDTGIGISKDKQAIIFDRFSQADKRLSRKYGGLGLGLSIAKENVEILKGKLGVDSEPGKGSRFFFTIPFEPVNKKLFSGSSLNKTDNDSNEGLLTVLIAEDEEVNYLYIEALLKHMQLGVVIHHAKNGKEAVDFCRASENVSLILMDIKMPIMDGIQATKEIKKRSPGIKIIVQTAFSDSEKKKLAFDAGCDAYITKPINKTELQKTINQVLSFEKA
ncbi:MAG: PAS domain S-box protein [Bacteroidales bacterium]|nr:PAS domain S-box protein [Bacteroidales bacterium]MBN2818089.1 PAS domain S-box protein [Bacteroidales bacterium]